MSDDIIDVLNYRRYKRLANDQGLYFSNIIRLYL